jgi:hypothetical protein
MQQTNFEGLNLDLDVHGGLHLLDLQAHGLGKNGTSEGHGGLLHPRAQIHPCACSTHMRLEAEAQAGASELEHYTDVAREADNAWAEVKVGCKDSLRDPQVINAACSLKKLFDPSKHKKSADRWASDVAERIMYILAHTQLIANSELKFKQATSGLAESSRDELREMIKDIRLDGHGFDDMRDTAEVEWNTTAGSDKAPTAGRSLKQHDSLASWDSDGLPNMQKLWSSTVTVEDTAGTKKSAAAASDPVPSTCFYAPVPPTKAHIRAMKKPAAATKHKRKDDEEDVSQDEELEDGEKEEKDESDGEDCESQDLGTVDESGALETPMKKAKNKTAAAKPMKTMKSKTAAAKPTKTMKSKARQRAMMRSTRTD